jgi:hypothetical protein
MTQESGPEKLWNLIKKHRFAMLTTLEGEEVLRSRKGRLRHRRSPAYPLRHMSFL